MSNAGLDLGRRSRRRSSESWIRSQAQPNFYPQVYQDVREAIVSGFPYCVYYVEEPNQVVVLAVFHTARNPSIWQGRA
jgi:plasmid stabilization system protein ParE